MSFMHRTFPHFPTGQVLLCSVPGWSGIGGRDECGAVDCLGLSLRLVGGPVRSIGTIVSNLAAGHPSSSLILSLWRSEGKRTGRWLPAKVTGKLRITDISSSQPRQRLTAPWPHFYRRPPLRPSLAAFPVPPCPSLCAPSAALCSLRLTQPQRPAELRAAARQAQPSRPPSGGVRAGAAAGAARERCRR